MFLSEVSYSDEIGIYSLHQMLYRTFDGRTLFRAEHGKAICVSQTGPVGNVLRTRPFNPKVAEGLRLRFSLRANMMHSISRREGRGKKVPLVSHLRLQGLSENRAIQEAAEIWMQKKGRQHGFSVLECQAVDFQVVRVSKPGGRHSKEMVDIVGEIEVQDAPLLHQALKSGIGPAKAFGCGLLQLRSQS